MPILYIGRQPMETTMGKHIARMMDGDAYSMAVVKADAVLAAAVLAVAVAVHLA